MHDIHNRKPFVKEIQHSLRVVEHQSQNLSKIAEDGLYNQETADAVRVFQEKRGLTPTGETD
ncbi:MAG: peptidoglycan-binding protein, partial [Clostridia bacterium]|nr:peptidoglycan-binding protein [Clostridia bacterium]